MDMGTKIILENCEVEENYLIINPDMGGIEDRNLIGFSITIGDENIPLSKNELDPEDGSETYFYINKNQTKVLINYLQALYEDM